MMLWLMGSFALAVGAVSPSNGSMAVKFGGEEEIPCFLQVSMERQLPQAPEKKHHTHFHLGERWPLWVIRNHMQKGVVTPKSNSSGWQVAYEPEKVTPLLHSLGQFSKGMVIFLYVCLMIMVLAWLMRGLPKKAPQDEKVKDGCPRTWLIFLCSTYGFIYFTTDQYAPSLPQMGVDLSGSQDLMIATVQMNFVTKSALGLVIAGISDYVGRRPVMVCCLPLLALASFACGCAPNADWFVAARFLQSLGEAVEPLIFAACRDYFAKPQDRIMVITAVELISSTAQMVAPIFGGFSSVVFGWRFSFFCLALVWGLHAAYAARYMIESCPDAQQEEKEGSYFFGIRKILAPASLFLLLTESCVIVPFQVFNANFGYVAQVNYGQSAVATAFFFLGWSVVDAVGIIVMQWWQYASGLSIHRVSRTVMVMFGLTGIFSLYLGSFADHLSSYLTASFLQSLLNAAALILLNVLYFEPLEQCAGLAASFEILAQDFLPCFYSMICTQSLIHSGVESYMDLQSVSFVAAPIFYLGYELVSRRPANCQSDGDS